MHCLRHYYTSCTVQYKICLQYSGRTTTVASGLFGFAFLKKIPPLGGFVLLYTIRAPTPIFDNLENFCSSHHVAVELGSVREVHRRTANRLIHLHSTSWEINRFLQDGHNEEIVSTYSDHTAGGSIPSTSFRIHVHVLHAS